MLTPLAVDPSHPFPTSLACRSTSRCWYAIPRRASASSPGSRCRPCSPASSRWPGRYVALEDVIAHHLDQLFSGMQVVGHHTPGDPQEDVEVEEDDAENLLLALEKELLRRKVGRPPVRLEVEDDMDPKMLELLVSELDISERRSSTCLDRSTCAACSPCRYRSGRAQVPCLPPPHPSPPRRGRNGEAPTCSRPQAARCAAAPPVRLIRRNERAALHRTGS